MEWSQANRPFRLNTPLGRDVMLLASWEGEEAISSLFRFTVVAWSRRHDIQPKELLLKGVSLDLRLPSGADRKLHGVVSRFVRGEIVAEGHMSYLLEIVPPHWMLTLGSSFDIFQNKTARDVCDELLTGTPHEWKLVRTLDPRPYCFRYRESRWTCVSRLAEQEGIWYRFDHKAGEAKLVLGDNTASAQEAWGVEALMCLPDTNGNNFSKPVVTELNIEHHPYTAKTQVRSLSEFLTGNNLLGETSGASEVFSPPAELLWYEYDQQLTAHHTGINHSGGETPSDVSKFQPDTKTYSRIGQERSEADATRYIGRSSYVGLEVGAKTRVKGRSESKFDGDVFITRVQHKGSNGDYVSGESEATYENTFEAIPISTPYRPPRRTPWPRVAGAHVGTVVGPQGEEIYTDKHGRVQVVFKWDLENSTKLERSCWIRVAQSFAGQQFGMVFLPRIGHEVIVDFLDGNPDNPVVVGSLYNSANLPPWPLPANKTQSGVRTKSTLQGGAENYNELRFEDKKGNEQIYVQAEKDLDTLVKNDETRKVEHDRTTTIKNNETKTVLEGYEHTTIEKGEQVIKVNDNNRILHVEKNHTVTVNGNESISVTGNRDITVKGNQSHKISGDDKVTVEGKQSITITEDETFVVEKGNQSLTVKKGNIDTKAELGNIGTKAALGKITLEAMQKIELKVGANSIVIDQSGVTIKGIMVKIEGSAMAQMKAPMTQVNGDGMVMVKGGITMIN